MIYETDDYQAKQEDKNRAVKDFMNHIEGLREHIHVILPDPSQNKNEADELLNNVIMRVCGEINTVYG